MARLTIKELSDRFRTAFRLHAEPLAIYGAKSAPEGGVHLSSVHRCIAVAMYRMATGRTEADALWVGEGHTAGCCPGGLSHTGFAERPEHIPWFVSTGREDFRGGAAEYLKAGPELVEACFRAAGAVTPPGPCLVIHKASSVPEGEADVRSLCIFGDAETIRNIGALAHFDRDDPFFPVLVPWGPACATYVTYPAGLAANAPEKSAFMGPQDPTVNWSIPPDTMGIGIPVSVAQRMAGNIDRSFVGMRPRVAFPGHERDGEGR
jgi:hypothetical protein